MDLKQDQEASVEMNYIQNFKHTVAMVRGMIDSGILTDHRTTGDILGGGAKRIWVNLQDNSSNCQPIPV
jgi:hypothetical protein